MNILKSIRRSWLWYSLCLLVFTISFTKYVPLPICEHHRLSWWNLLCMLLPFGLGVWANSNSWLIFRPIRWLCWPATRDFLKMRFKSLKDNPMLYPALIWLELGDAERAFVTGGARALTAAFEAQTEKLRKGLTDALTKFAGPQDGHLACGCHDECDCAGIPIPPVAQLQSAEQRAEKQHHINLANGCCA